MGREEHLLSRSIADTFTNAWAEERKLSALMPLEAKSAEDPIEERREGAKRSLSYLIERLYRDIGILAERLDLPQFAAQVREEFKSLGEKLTEMTAHPEETEFANLPLAKAHAFYQSLSALSDKWVTGIDVFKTILQNTPAIIREKKLVPEKEVHVRNAVLEVLNLCFHDAMREIPVGHLLKTYKPDIGVRSLKAAAEYKFARTEQEVRNALDGIYADMKGYAGHHEWQTFFAVIYTTDALIHQEKIEEEFRGVNAETTWTPIILVGRGGLTS